MLRRCLFLLVGLVVLGLPAGASADEGCANEALRPVGSYSSRLPDCRAFEQVSPVDKGGASVSGFENGVQASPSGDRIVYVVPTNMPGAQGAYQAPQFLATRGEEGWSNQGLAAPFQPDGRSSLQGWSEDLSEVLDQVEAISPSSGAVSPGTGESLYLRDSVTGLFQLLDSPYKPSNQEAYPAGFSSDDSRVIFESRAQLLPSAAAGRANLYEWHGGVLSLAGVLPDGSTPPGGSFAGPYNWYSRDISEGGASRFYYTQNTISSDGSRVFFTAGETGQLYVRENGSRAVQVSASQRTVPDPNGPKPAAFMAATPDGSRVFFTSCEKLTDDSTAVSTVEPSCTREEEGQDLYEYNVDSGALSDLTVDNNVGDVRGAAVGGVLGVGSGSSGTYTYFVASGVLAGGATPGGCSGHGSDDCKLYVWHDGTVSLITTLTTPSDQSDFTDWLPLSEGGVGGRTSRVNSDGRVLLFSADLRLTAYDNAGLREFYRYDAATGRLACVSCNPRGGAPTGGANLRSLTISIQSSPPSILTRNLSADGSRVFFESPDGLVPQDTNGVQDVYEWELAGAGNCRESSESFNSASGGCLYLVSTGRSSERSFFADASANGDNVFFFTDQPLVGQDQDGLVDVYDARVGGGLAAQNPPAPPSPCAGDACRGAVGPAAPAGIPSSATFSGTGNLAPVVSVPPVKAKAKKPKAKKKRPVRRRRKARKAMAGHGSAKRAHKTTRGSK